jgi:hypothetical protein
MSTITVETRPGGALPVAGLADTAAIARLIDVCMDADDLLNNIVTAVGDVKTHEGTSRAEEAVNRLYSLVEDLASGYLITVAR